MGSVHLGEPDQRVLDCPQPGHIFLDLMRSDSEVHVGIVSLPRITCQADLSAHSRPLMCDTGEYQSTNGT